MAKYEVWMVARPEGFRGASLDDVPPQPGQRLKALSQTDELLVAVRAAMDFNAAAQRDGSAAWAVVVEPTCPGQAWPDVRLCTPLGYRAAAIQWPVGWEPQSPWDVPRCPSQIQPDTAPTPLNYDRALAVVRSLNQQAIDQAGSLWYVVVAVENEPVAQTVAYDPSGVETTVQTRRLHIVRPDEGGHGDCSYCPAHSLPCATGETVDSPQTAAVTSSRSLYGGA